MARPREFDENEVKQRIMCVFWEKGYEGTSMQDLVAATGLLKGSLYGAFGDKKAMYLAALAHYDQTHIQSGIDMLKSEGSAQQKIGRLFDSVIESVKTTVFAGGCFLCNASVEMAAVDEDVQKVVQNQIERLKASMTRALVADAPRADKVDALASYIVSAYLGTRVIAKAGMPIQMITDTKNYCLERITDQ